MFAKETRLRAGASAAVAASLALGMAVAAPAVAQETSARTAEVITVTARKTAESLQTVPVTVTAISAQTIERFRYDKVAELTARIPTLNVAVGGSGSGGQLSLRGVGSSNISASFDSAVAFDFDGIQVSTMRIVQSAFFDVQQIEVLKGPQSLFFGKSASAGVISIKSANPTVEFEAGGTLAYEFEEQGITAEAFASGPMGDKAGFRIAARFNDINKTVFNTAPVVNKKRGEQNVNVRATFQFDPTDNFSANLKLNYIGQENDGAVRKSIADCNHNGRADEIGLFAAAGTYAIVTDQGYGCNDPSTGIFFMPDGLPALSVQAAGGQDLNGGVPYGTSDIFFGRLEMNWDITDDVTLTSVTGYLDQSAQDLEWYSYGGITPEGTSSGYGGGLTDHQLEQFTQELRIATHFDAPINFMFGLFYESRKIEFNTNQYALNVVTLFGPDPLTGNTTDYFKTHHYDNEAFSIFGQLQWDITDRLELSGGVRWTDETKVNVISVPYMHGFLESIGFVPSGFVGNPITFKDSNLSPELTFSYQVADDISLYASYKTGFKSGGIDNSALPSAGLLGLGSDDPEVVAETAAALIYDSETAEGGEIGAKMQFANRTVTVNVSAYYYVFTDLQVQNFDAIAIQFATSNASELTTKGFDVDFNWLTKIDGLSVFGALAYTNAKYTKPFNPELATQDPDNDLLGRASARAPKWAGNIGADYRVPVGNGLELGFTGNMQFSGSYFTNDDTQDDHIQDSFVTFDLAASIGSIDGGWQVAVIGRNVGDKRFVNTSGGRPFLLAPGNGNGLPGGDDQVFGLNTGRNIFLEASFRF